MEGVALLHQSLAYGPEQLVEFDTHISPHGSSRLDLFVTDYSDYFSVESYPFAINHVAVIARGNIEIPPPIKHERSIRQYHRTDWDDLQNFLSGKPWCKFSKEAPYKAAALYGKAITKAIEPFVPSKTVEFSCRDKPWFNAGCRKATRTKKKAHKKWCLTNQTRTRLLLLALGASLLKLYVKLEPTTNTSL